VGDKRVFWPGILLHSENRLDMTASRLKFAVAAILSSLLVLAVVKWVWNVPKPLLVVSGIIFWGCFIPALILNADFKRAVWVRTMRLLFIWISASALFFGIVYRWDQAGWIWFKVTGYNVTLPEDLSDLVDNSIADFVARNPFFSSDPQDSTSLVLQKGEYDINETIVVPQGSSLTIAPGTILRFKVGCSLISYSPIMARGTEREPIVFTAQNKWRKWGVVGVVNKGKSIFEHTRFEHGRQALVNDISFLGTLSLIETETEIARSQFFNLFGKDGAYVHGGRVFFQNNTFRDCFKDGVDFDGGAGKISQNRFVNCGDEAIDLGEDSNVQVFANNIVGSKDAQRGANGKRQNH
jgi:hypothetical protein